MGSTCIVGRRYGQWREHSKQGLVLRSLTAWKPGDPVCRRCRRRIGIWAGAWVNRWRRISPAICSIDVRDTGRDVTKGARFSVTNAESTFHNDNAFSPRIPDYVALLCVRTARVGGSITRARIRCIGRQLWTGTVKSSRCTICDTISRWGTSGRVCR